MITIKKNTLPLFNAFMEEAKILVCAPPLHAKPRTLSVRDGNYETGLTTQARPLSPVPVSDVVDIPRHAHSAVD